MGVPGLVKTRLVISAVWYSIVIYILIQIASSKNN